MNFGFRAVFFTTVCVFAVFSVFILYTSDSKNLAEHVNILHMPEPQLQGDKAFMRNVRFAKLVAATTTTKKATTTTTTKKTTTTTTVKPATTSTKKTTTTTTVKPATTTIKPTTTTYKSTAVYPSTTTYKSTTINPSTTTTTVKITSTTSPAAISVITTTTFWSTTTSAILTNAVLTTTTTLYTATSTTLQPSTTTIPVTTDQPSTTTLTDTFTATETTTIPTDTTNTNLQTDTTAAIATTLMDTTTTTLPTDTTAVTTTTTTVWFGTCSTSQTPVPTLWRMSDFKGYEGQDPYTVLGGLSDTSNTKPFRSIIPDPLDNTTSVIQIFYPNGSFTTNQAILGGTVFYFRPSPIKFCGIKRTRLCYSVRFQDTFMFNIGGKLPGLFGPKPSQCSDPPNCFSTRHMWRNEGGGELYPSFNISLQPVSYCYTPPSSTCNVSPRGVGDEIATGSFSFTPGQWTRVCQEITLNDIGANNGIVSVVVDGSLRIFLENMVIHNGKGFGGVAFHTFFGGNSTVWSSPKDQYSYFTDFEIETFTF